MKRYDGEYSGAALQSFTKGLPSSLMIQKILQSHGLEGIDPSQWYDLELARAIYYDVAREIGMDTLYRVGLQMIESAPFPPTITDVPSVLSSLDAAYKMNVRGPEIGGIATEFDGEEQALITFSTPFPCALERGIIVGCCKRFGGMPLLEHVPTGCRDDGAPACQYRVTW